MRETAASFGVLLSVPDEEYANNHNIDIYVEAEVIEYPLSGDASQVTYNWGGWQHGGSVGSTTNYSNGNIGNRTSSGGAPTWTNC